MTRSDIENWFTHHAPAGNQPARYVALRDKARELALLIFELAPKGADQTASIRKLREAIMTANAAIACEEHFGFSNIIPMADASGGVPGAVQTDPQPVAQA
jgi:hypothetical protein